VSPSNIDQDSFDEAYDAELNAGSNNDERPYVWVIPEQGETILSTIKRIMQHWSHMLTYTKGGKIALRAVDELTDFFVAIDNNSNIKGLKHRADKSLILNKSLAMHGGGYMKRTAYPNAASLFPFLNARYEPHLKSDYEQAFTDEYSNTASITKYGERQFGSRVRAGSPSEREALENYWLPFVAGMGTGYSGYATRTISFQIEGEPIKVAHYPLIHKKDIKDNVMKRFTTNEAELRTFVEIKQDFMGLDYEIGSIVYVPSLGGDFRCIKQTIDFNNFNVQSELVSNFPTEYATASTVIWTYVNLDDAPVGTTVLSESSGTMTLEIDLTTTAGLDWHYQIFISKDGQPWEEFSTGWDAETANLDIQDSWSGNTQSVDIVIRAADDDGIGGQCTPTPWVTMPTATQ